MCEAQRMLGGINTAISDVREAAICFAYVADIIVNQKRSLCVWSAVGFHGRKESPCIWRYWPTVYFYK